MQIFPRHSIKIHNFYFNFPFWAFCIFLFKKVTEYKFVCKLYIVLATNLFNFTVSACDLFHQQCAIIYVDKTTISTVPIIR